MRSYLLCLLLVPASAFASPSDVSDFSFLDYELLLDGQVVRGAGVVASDHPSFNRWGTDRGTLRLSCANGRRTLSSMPLFEGGVVNFSRKGDQIHVQVRESKIQSLDERIKQVPADQCQDLAATELVVVDRTFTLPADTGGRKVTVDIGDGYSLHASTQAMKSAAKP